MMVIEGPWNVILKSYFLVLITCMCKVALNIGVHLGFTVSNCPLHQLCNKFLIGLFLNTKKRVLYKNQVISHLT